jgi:DNA primase
MYYPEDLIEEVRIRNDIVDVISGYIKLEKKGKNYWGLCPFHNEKTPSFSVEPAKQFYHCFGCSNGGNVIHFIMNIEKLDFIEAFKLLAERAGVNLPEPEDSRERKKPFAARRFSSLTVRPPGSSLTPWLGRMD